MRAFGSAAGGSFGRRRIGFGRRRGRTGSCGFDFFGFVAVATAVGAGLVAGQVLLVASLEVGFVPATAGQAEAPGRQLLGELAFIAGRADLQRLIAEFLDSLQLVVAGLALIRIDGHNLDHLRGFRYLVASWPPPGGQLKGGDYTPAAKARKRRNGGARATAANGNCGEFDALRAKLRTKLHKNDRKVYCLAPVDIIYMSPVLEP